MCMCVCGGGGVSLANLAGLKRTFPSRGHQKERNYIGRTKTERGSEVTVRHAKYFMSCWSGEERVSRKVGSTHLLNSG